MRATGKIWVTSTVLEGNFAIRVMTANVATEESHVRAAFKSQWELNNHSHTHAHKMKVASLDGHEST